MGPLNFLLRNLRIEGSKALNNGGGFYIGDVGDDRFKDFRELTFINNTAINGLGGGIYVQGELINFIDGTFVRNESGDLGGAIYLNGTNQEVKDSRFVGNVSQISGAGLYVHGSATKYARDHIDISGSVFIGNNATGAKIVSTTHADAISGTGAAAYLHNRNNNFVNITAIGNTGYDGNGSAAGAFFVVHNGFAQGAVLGVRAVNGDARYYGNRVTDSGAYRAIVFDANTALTQTIQGVVGSSDRMLMLDGMKAVYSGNHYNTNFSKTGTGAWYQGGDVVVDQGVNEWQLANGDFVLTTVDYGAGDMAASINLGANGTFSLREKNMQPNRLVGSGTIVANDIVLRNEIAPEVWKNTGLKATEIASEIAANGDLTQAQIDSIDVARISEYGVLAFNGNVEMDDAIYNVDVNVDSVQKDQLAITGALNVVNPSTINVTSLTWSAAPPVLTSDGSLPTGVVAGVITTTGGIVNGNNLRLTAGGALAGESADFLQVQGKQNGNDYDLELGLRWHSNRTVAGSVRNFVFRA